MRVLSAAIFILFSCATLTGQEHQESIESRLNLDERKSAICSRNARERAEASGIKLLVVAGHCFSGCPVSLPKPWYPEWARRNRWQGQVRVEVISDDTGEVVLAKILDGPAPFYQPALAAARASVHSRIVACGEPVYYRWVVRYMFTL